jgi:hypothetical protein
MSRDLNSAKQKYFDVVDKVEDPILREELLNAVQLLVAEVMYASKPRDVLDMD